MRTHRPVIEAVFSAAERGPVVGIAVMGFEGRRGEKGTEVLAGRREATICRA
jgi:hypothetical protein